MDTFVNSLIEGEDVLIERPVGSGESTMIGLAKTVYAMTYLRNKANDSGHRISRTQND